MESPVSSQTWMRWSDQVMFNRAALRMPATRNEWGCVIATTIVLFLCVRAVALSTEPQSLSSPHDGIFSQDVPLTATSAFDNLRAAGGDLSSCKRLDEVRVDYKSIEPFLIVNVTSNTGNNTWIRNSVKVFQIPGAEVESAGINIYSPTYSTDGRVHAVNIQGRFVKLLASLPDIMLTLFANAGITADAHPAAKLPIAPRVYAWARQHRIPFAVFRGGMYVVEESVARAIISCAPIPRAHIDDIMSQLDYQAIQVLPRPFARRVVMKPVYVDEDGDADGEYKREESFNNGMGDDGAKRDAHKDENYG
eukprot:Opistho-2@32647